MVQVHGMTEHNYAPHQARIYIIRCEHLKKFIFYRRNFIRYLLAAASVQGADSRTY